MIKFHVEMLLVMVLALAVGVWPSGELLLLSAKRWQHAIP